MAGDIDLEKNRTNQSHKLMSLISFITRIWLTVVTQWCYNFSYNHTNVKLFLLVYYKRFIIITLIKFSTQVSKSLLQNCLKRDNDTYCLNMFDDCLKTSYRCLKANLYLYYYIFLLCVQLFLVLRLVVVNILYRCTN